MHSGIYLAAIKCDGGWMYVNAYFNGQYWYLSSNGKEPHDEHLKRRHVLDRLAVLAWLDPPERAFAAVVEKGEEAPTTFLGRMSL